VSNVAHPRHYNAHESGIECIEIAEHMSFNLGNAVKYLWRAGLKGERGEDIAKAKFLLDRVLMDPAPNRLSSQSPELHRYIEKLTPYDDWVMRTITSIMFAQYSGSMQHVYDARCAIDFYQNHPMERRDDPQTQLST
jgi:uncharacterized protein DUF3310